MTRAEARRRANACKSVSYLVEIGSTQASAIDRAAKARGLSPNTLRNWWVKVRALPGSAWVQTLTSKRGLASRTRAVFSADAWEYIKADYLRPENPSIAECITRLLRLAPSMGWQVPSNRTIYRRLQSISWNVVSQTRRGSTNGA